jgi:hypothetical protein
MSRYLTVYLQFAQKLENEEKYTADDVFDHFHSLLEEYDTNIDELIN